ncbi:PWWP domain-containing DNA repair factor 3A [Echinops telfairi]|uniref:PWWP domain-containing DNA repair factor 3A n=1 Tax=Echinops telfairi TaxID=9371 RepID=A0AC59C767_ECHTE|nr:PWWP domain-containing DNA repair factor 3A [Echinops telfairi]
MLTASYVIVLPCLSDVRIPSSKQSSHTNLAVLLRRLRRRPPSSCPCPSPHRELHLQSCLLSKLGPQLTLSLRLERIKVRSTGVKILKKSQIEDIASSLVSQDGAPAAPLEELAYRRSLRVALDVLNEGTGSYHESPSGGEKAALCPSSCPVDPANWLRGSHSASLHRRDMLGSPPYGRKGRAQHSWSSSPACDKDLECMGGIGALHVGARSRDGNRSKTHQKPGMIRLSDAQKSSLGQNTLPFHAGAEREEGSEMGADSPPTLAMPLSQGAGTQVRTHESDLLSPGVPLPVLRDSLLTSELPKKRLRWDGSQKSPGEAGAGPEGCVALHGAARLAPALLPEPGKAEEGCRSPELSPLNSVLDEDEDEEEPPKILLYHEPRTFEVGMLVWLKYQKYPFWPAVVKSLRRRDKKASVLFIEGNMNPKGRGIAVSLRRLKHFDCEEKQSLLHKAKQDFEQAVSWCVALITDYRVRLGCGSFTGSFLEYYAADISCPVRKSIQQDILGAAFPQLSRGDPEEPEVGSPLGQSTPSRKVLPDRTRAARDRANQKLVEFIVKAKGAESHLRAILRSRKPSRWLQASLCSSQYVTCVETYLEDEEQLDLVVKYLQRVCQETGSTALTRAHGDCVRLILDVLLPEAIICAISAVEEVDYKTAEQKYIKGPCLSYREKEIFDNQLREGRRRQQQQQQR